MSDIFIFGSESKGIDKEVLKRKIESNNHPDLLWVEPSYIVQGKSISQGKAKLENS